MQNFSVPAVIYIYGEDDDHGLVEDTAPGLEQHLLQHSPGGGGVQHTHWMQNFSVPRVTRAVSAAGRGGERRTREKRRNAHIKVVVVLAAIFFFLCGDMILEQEMYFCTDIYCLLHVSAYNAPSMHSLIRASNDVLRREVEGNLDRQRDKDFVLSEMDDSGDGKSLALHTSHVDPFLPLSRAQTATYVCAILALFYYHCLHLLSSTTFLSFFLTLSLFISDAALAFMWSLSQAYLWRPVYRHVYPERLASKVDKKDFPALDVFICTADPLKEPPIGVVNTALSVMAYDYPTEKLSVYVSDDGGSELTLFAFMEAARFAKHWLPFCRLKEIQERCPESYFRSNACGSVHCEEIQLLYQRMKEKVESVVEKGRVDSELLISEEERKVFSKWTTGFSRHEHPSVVQVVQVLLESSKDLDVRDNPLPNLVYVSREKSKASPHHFKAGALNVLLRVSNTMTNAPIILTLDCDMISNDPKTPHQALCYLLDEGLAEKQKLAFVQFPQLFSGINKYDTYGGDLIGLTQFIHGMDGLNGLLYAGTGAFFFRRALHGCTLPSLTQSNGSVKCDQQVLTRAHQVASCTYEHGTNWGSTTGFRYGSLVEDYFTGLQLLCEGWTSVFCNPQRPAFLGDVLISLNDTLNQSKRWCMGLLEVAFSPYCPLIFCVKNASLPIGMAYSYYAFWACWSIPMCIYGILPQIALVFQLPMFPKALDPWFFLYLYLFLGAYARDLVEYLKAGGSSRRWWSNQRMWMVRGVTSYPFAVVEFLLKHLGFPATGFNVTSKSRDNDQNRRYEKGLFEFGVSSPFVVSLGAFATISFISFAVGLTRALKEGIIGDLVVQLFISGFVVVNCWPIYQAMVFRKDDGRIPRKCILVSLFLTGVISTIAYLILGIEGELQGKT